MPADKKPVQYEKPKISRIKLNLGESIMANCKQATQKTNAVKNTQMCATTTTCNLAVS